MDFIIWLLLLGLQPLLALLDSEYAIIQQLALESLIQITLDGNWLIHYLLLCIVLYNFINEN